MLHLERAVHSLEEVVGGLEADRLSPGEAGRLLGLFERAERVGAAGKAVLARRVGGAADLARKAGTSVGRARGVLELSRRLRDTPELDRAVRRGLVSLDQATEIAKAETVAPGSAGELLKLVESGSYRALRDKARSLALDAARGDLAARQHAARGLRHRLGDLGMVHLEADLEPHVGGPIVRRLEAEARRLETAAMREGRREPFSAHLADAFTGMCSGSGRGGPRPELVVLVSHGVAKRGWRDVAIGEVCKIPGVGPVAPSVAREIAEDAFLSGVFYDGKDLRQLRRWTRKIPVEVRLALELGKPPDFDGVQCVDCGNRFRVEFDHVEPHAAGGPASMGNLRPRCRLCHRSKTRADRRARRLRPASVTASNVEGLRSEERGPPR